MKNKPILVKYNNPSDIISAFTNTEYEEDVFNNIIHIINEAHSNSKLDADIFIFEHTIIGNKKTLNSKNSHWKKLITDILDKSVSNEFYETASNARDLLKLI